MCPIKYNTQDGFDGNGFKELLKTLSDSSQKSGFSIIRKGYYKYRDIKYARIVCSMFEYYRGKLDKRKSSEYRVYSFHNDRKNSRGKDGKKLARKSRTGRNLAYEGKCSCFFLIGLDLVKGFYAAPGRGQLNHTGHAKCGHHLFKASVKNIDEQSKLMIHELFQCQSSPSIISNLIQSRSGITLSNAKIIYHFGIMKRHNNKSAIPLEGCDNILDWFTKKKYDHIILYHDSLSKSILSDHIQVSKDIHDMFTVQYPPSEEQSANQEAVRGRHSLNVSAEQRYLMAFAWVIPEESQMFRLFLEVVTVDVVKSTNN